MLDDEPTQGPQAGPEEWVSYREQFGRRRRRWPWVVGAAGAAAAAGAVVLVLTLHGGSGPLTLQALAGRLGCTDLKQTTDVEMFVREEGSCTFAGAPVTLYTFGTSSSEQNWLQIAAQVGGAYVSGDEWVITMDTQQAAEAVRGKLGGQIH